jgi:hypothetical protein
VEDIRNRNAARGVVFSMTTYEATAMSNKPLLRTYGCGYLNRWLTKLNAGLMILDPYGKAKSPASSFPHRVYVHVRYMNFCDAVQVACALALLVA